MSDEAQGKTTGPQFFVSYRHTPDDETWMGRVVTHLRALEKARRLRMWHDQQNAPGTLWRDDLKRALAECDVALLLVSADSLTSDFILDEEVRPLLTRRDAGRARVIPVLVRPCAWKQIPWLEPMQLWPRDGRPLSALSPNDAEQALADLCAEVLTTPLSGRSPGPASAPRVSLTHLPPGSGDSVFLGRGQELALLDTAWADAGRTHIVTLVAAGGVGKTTLVRQWLQHIKEDHWRGASRVYAWSFYSQGTDENRQASDDTFLDEALTWFGIRHDAKSAADKGQRLAEALSHERALLILDGVEPLQYPPGPLGGRLRAPGVEALLTHVATAGAPGLIVVTTREALTDLSDCERNADRPAGAVVAHDVSNLDEADGARVLHRLGVTNAGAAKIADDDEELREASREVKGHALTLSLLGNFLKRAHGGDIRARDKVKLSAADEAKGGPAERVISAYVLWLEKGGDDSRRALAAAWLLGFFDRPADPACLKALRAAPPIPGLTEALTDLSDADWSLTLSLLFDCGLALSSDPKAPLDAHPLVREIFARRLRDERRDAWREGHRRLYEHLKSSAPHRPEGLAGLQPLYQAVAHGCHAGLHQQACDEVYRDRILRGTGDDGFYSSRKLGAIGSDLTAVACFFDEPWSRLAPGLSEGDQAWLLNEAALSLRSQGRLTEAVQPMRAALSMRVKQQLTKKAAQIASNLSELELTLGDVAAAIADAEQSVAHADRSGDAAWRMASRTTLADALHQTGRRAKAAQRFREAEALQAQRQPEYPLLYSLPGFRYCDVVLAEAERAAAVVALRRFGLAPLDPLAPRAPLDPIAKHSHLAKHPLSPASGGEGRGEGVVDSSRAADPSAPHPNPLPASRGEGTPGQQGEGTPGQRGEESADGRGEVGDVLAAVEQRATTTLGWVRTRLGLLTIALDHLTLARVALYRALLERERAAADNLATAGEHATQAVDGLRASGDVEFAARGLLTRAWLRAVEGDAEHAKADIDEAQRIAERGAMRLHLADVHLHRARLFRDRRALASARTLIEECGYHRRDEELRDAEEASRSWPDA